MRVSDFMNQWLAGKTPDLEQSTLEAYQIYLGKHICPYFDALGKDLEELQPLDVRGYVTNKRNGGRCDGQPGGLSAVSVRKHLNIIKQAFREAVLFGVIPVSPAEPVKVPKGRSVSAEARFIPLSDAKAIIKAFEGHRLHPVVYITMIYGLRRSEVLGLKWNAIDFAAGTLTIRHTVVKNRSIVAKDRTKSLSSHRTFPLLDEIAAMLRPIRAADRHREGYVFHRDDGSPIRPDTLTRTFQRVLKRHYLPQMRFHDLRHATASILFDQGWSVADVQHWLGHTDFETTMNIYVAYNRTRMLKVGGALSGLLQP